MKNIVRFLKNKSGATAIEYGLIAALIAVAVITGVSALGDNANKTFTNVSDEILQNFRKICTQAPHRRLTERCPYTQLLAGSPCKKLCVQPQMSAFCRPGHVLS